VTSFVAGIEQNESSWTRCGQERHGDHEQHDGDHPNTTARCIRLESVRRALSGGGGPEGADAEHTAEISSGRSTSRGLDPAAHRSPSGTRRLSMGSESSLSSNGSTAGASDRRCHCVPATGRRGAHRDSKKDALVRSYVAQDPCGLRVRRRMRRSASKTNLTAVGQPPATPNHAWAYRLQVTSTAAHSDRAQASLRRAYRSPWDFHRIAVSTRKRRQRDTRHD
jgi:hypothetical protein